MIRAAAKNYQNVLVVVDPKDYDMVAKALINGKVTDKLRQSLAAKAFYHLSFYDSQIGQFLNREQFPTELTIPLRKKEILRYGENPHQKGAFYLQPNTNSPLANLKYLWGRTLSGTNIGDVSSGLDTVKQFKEPAACVIKHHSPCGVAVGANAKEALERAIEADPVSAFGGVIVINRKMDVMTAKVIASFKNEMEGNIDIVAVPDISKDALELLKKIRKSMGIYTFEEIPQQRSENLDVKLYGGAALVETFDDNAQDRFKDWKVMTKKKPTEKHLELMKFGWKVVKAVRSNAVLVVDGKIPMTRGIGAGQTSRIGACKISLEQATLKYTNGGILASDAFFPFDDCVKLAADFGIAAIIQPGGSVNDQASIDEANKASIPMVFTQRRAFKH